MFIYIYIFIFSRMKHGGAWEIYQFGFLEKIIWSRFGPDSNQKKLDYIKTRWEQFSTASTNRDTSSWLICSTLHNFSEIVPNKIKQLHWYFCLMSDDSMIFLSAFDLIWSIQSSVFWSFSKINVVRRIFLFSPCLILCSYAES